MLDTLCQTTSKTGTQRLPLAEKLPKIITKVEKKAIEEAAIQAGGREVYILDEPMAGAIGANLNVNDPEGNMIVDIGGGTSEIAVLSLGGIVASNSLRIDRKSVV